MYTSLDQFKVIKNFTVVVRLSNGLKYRMEYKKGEVVRDKKTNQWIRNQMEMGNIIPIYLDEVYPF